ncbi:DNA-processing protein DprA [Corynebacterium sp. HS2168-gen11]|uniref:DNA-processing protein DprA n=1 Tax=Corynebacterium sp. HS2168-gen11 TaxID=2974027 RepID=UPI00216B210A|nr:DNA-processing protein DprA [Corynebacterium sp. HS2168-gen11]MCS4536291.1 DNA-processing protein DprA [Corynebacterium sp. HS2168-gen11]
MEQLLAWAYLSRVIEGPNRHLQQHLQQGKTATELAYAIRKRESWLGPLLAATEARYTYDRCEQDLALHYKLGGRLVTPDDQEWPTEMFQRAFGFAKLRGQEESKTHQYDAEMPHALWVRGENIASLCQQSVSIVGTRAASEYGLGVTRQITHELVQQQYTIVSGGAFGVDSAAHQEALESGGTTIAVLAHGLDRVYPTRNARLFQRIATSGKGALISEYPPQTPPQRHRFLTRNRLIAALSQGTVITSAAWRSGALNTLKWAAALGKVTMAVPGPITDVNCLGCLVKIRDGEATMVLSAREIVALLDKIGAIDIDGQYELDYAASDVQKLTQTELKVYDATSMRPAKASEIATRSGLTIGLTVHILMELAGKGLVIREQEYWKRLEHVEE